MPTSLTGATGEYYVAAELSRRGWLATVTIKNAPGTDVLAQELTTKRTVAIQTKTSTGGKSFTLTDRDEQTFDPDPGWVVLVGLDSPTDRPSFFVIPRCHLATMLYALHHWWLDQPGRKGQPHNDTGRRSVQRDSVAGYRDRWDLLNDATEKAPYFGDRSLLELLKTDRWRPSVVPRAMRPRLKRS